MPGVRYVGHDEGDEQRHPGHHFKREETRGTVADGQRALEVGAGRIVRRPVESSQEEYRHYHQHRSGRCEPESLAGLRERAFPDTCQHQRHACAPAY